MNRIGSHFIELAKKDMRRWFVNLPNQDLAYFPEGPDGLHDFSNPTDETVRMLAVSSKRFPDVVAYPERGYAWVATRHPERPVPEGGDDGIIARFEIPKQ